MRTRNSKSGNTMTARGGKRRGGPARDPIPRAQNRNTLRRTRQSASAHRNSSESPPAPSTLERTRRGLANHHTRSPTRFTLNSPS